MTADEPTQQNTQGEAGFLFSIMLFIILNLSFVIYLV